MSTKRNFIVHCYCSSSLDGGCQIFAGLPTRGGEVRGRARLGNISYFWQSINECGCFPWTSISLCTRGQLSCSNHTGSTFFFRLSRPNISKAALPMSSRNCGSCTAPNPAEHKFCSNCGAKLLPAGTTGCPTPKLLLDP